MDGTSPTARPKLIGAQASLVGASRPRASGVTAARFDHARDLRFRLTSDGCGTERRVRWRVGEFERELGSRPHVELGEHPSLGATVFSLMNSRWAMTRLRCRAAASCAMVSSRLVSRCSSSGVVRRAGWFAAPQSTAGPLHERPCADGLESFMGECQLLMSCCALACASSPFAVEQMGTRKHDGDPGALEVVDRAFEFLGRDWTGID